MSWAAATQAMAQSIPTLIFALIIFLIIVILVVKGKISWKGKGLSVGEQQASQDLERQILRAQMDICESSTVEIIRQLPEELQNYRGYYIAERCGDRVARWISLNHLSKDSLYKNLKKEEIHAVCFSLMDREKAVSPDFITALDKAVDTLIDKLVDIRVYFEEKSKD